MTIIRSAFARASIVPALLTLAKFAIIIACVMLLGVDLATWLTVPSAL